MKNIIDSSEKLKLPIGAVGRYIHLRGSFKYISEY